MFNPKEAADDSRALNIVILFFVAVAVIFSIGLHFDSALKYWLLSKFGETATGTVVQITKPSTDPNEMRDLARQSPRNYLKNRQTWVTGDSLLIEFQPESGTLEYVSFKRPPGSTVGQAGKAIDIVYLPLNPRIAHPRTHLADFAFDAKIMMGSLIAAMITFWLLVEAFVSWIRFRKTMRHY
ncbi:MULTISPECIES: hypothetical protein [unclassified Roseibium]|uniref:hypothetical protein n=1 Tax=unclassified Roseibium TaxID=2629323 RepID=UPI00273F8254|nr:MULTISPECIES: hypothetical protein [unclassified Roseibium]